MADTEVHIDVDGRTPPVGLIHSNKTVVFEYAPTWLADPNRLAPLANTIWTA